MESSSRNTTDFVYFYGQKMKYTDEDTSKQSPQDTTSTSTSTPNSTLKSLSSSSSPKFPKYPKPSTSESTTSQASIYPSTPFSNFPFSSNRSGTAPKISITTTIGSMISNHQNRNVGLSLMTRDLVASPVEDFILGSPLDGFM